MAQHVLCSSEGITSSLAAVAGQEAVVEAGYYYSVCRVKLEAPAVQNKGQTDSHSESQKSSVQALALPQPKEVMWNVGMGRQMSQRSGS